VSVAPKLDAEQSVSARYEALFGVSQAISAYRDPTELFRALADELRKVVQFDGIGVVQYDAAGNKTKWHLGVKCPQSEGSSYPELPREETITWWVYQNQQPFVTGSTERETRFPRMMEQLRGYCVQSACVLPLTTPHRRLGCLIVGSGQEEAYSPDEVHFLSVIARQVAVAMDDALNFEASQRAQVELQRERDRLQLLLDLNNNVVSILDLRDLLRAVSASVRRVMECDVVSVDLLDPETNRLRLFVLDFPESKGFFHEEMLVPMDSAPARVVATGKPLIVGLPDQSRMNPDLFRRLEAEGIKSACMLPLLSRGRALGVLALASRRENSFSQEDADFLLQVANQVAIAVDNALAYGQTAELKEKLQTLLEVSDAIAVNRDLEELFRDLAQRLPRILKFDIINLVLCDAEAQVVRLQFAIGPQSATLRPGLEFPIEESATGLVWKTQEPLVVEDVSLEKRFPKLANLLEETGVQSFCTVPLTSALRRLGAMNFGSLQKRTYAKVEVDFMRQVARQVATAVDNALAYGQIEELQEKLAQEKLYLEDEIRTAIHFEEFEEIVGKSSALRRVLKEIETVAPSDSTVLILGETGTGKELVARAIHDRSARKAHAFVKLNCAAIPTGLLESELFGHERGAFTGAIAQRVGRFELAHQGTIFLDEIAEIPLELQPKLLRVLQEREFERLGSTRTLRTDARLIAATNRDLQARVNAKEFRDDLFYRLNVFPVRVPPLRERAEDIPVLVRHFAEQFSRRMRKSIESIPTETMKALCRYSWPGNVRELQNVIERAVILSTGPVLKVPLADLLRVPFVEPGQAKAPKRPATTAVNGTLKEAERKHILAVLEETNWVLAGDNGAAARLGMKRSTLQFRMRKLGIARPAAS
jgi:formate hydrogenlyase transcriptional activator